MKSIQVIFRIIIILAIGFLGVFNAPGGSAMKVSAATGATLIATIEVGVYPVDVVVNSNTNLIYVANQSDKSVSVIDGATNTVIKTVPVGNCPTGIALNPTTNRIYVSDYDGISVIDGATNAVVSTLGVGSATGIAVNQSTNLIYVTNSGSNNLLVIDGAINAVITAVDVGTGAIGVGVNPTTNLIYVVKYNTVSVVDGTSNTVVATMGVGRANGCIDVNPRTNRIYCVNYADASVSVIDGATSTVIATVGVGGGPYDVFVNPISNRIYVTNVYQVYVIDGFSHYVEKQSMPATGKRNFSLDMNPVTNCIYIANTYDNTISVIQDGGVTTLPTLTSLVPNSGSQGQTLTGVVVNGANLAGATALTFSGTGVSASNLSVNSAGTQITANVTIAGSAALGPRDVTMITPAGTSAVLAGGFTVSGINIVQPQGGETWIIGSSQSIKWTSSGVTGNVNIYLSLDAGTTWEVIASGTPNDGSEDWVVIPPKTTLARMKITSVNDLSIVDTTGTNFMILYDKKSFPTLYDLSIINGKRSNNLSILTGFEAEPNAYIDAHVDWDTSYKKLLWAYGQTLIVPKSEFPKSKGQEEIPVLYQLPDENSGHTYTQIRYYAPPGQCVSAVKALSNNHTVVEYWTKGRNVMTGVVKPGTVVATFNVYGKYEGHVAIFKRYLSDGSGFEVWDQNWDGTAETMFGVFGKHNIIRDGTGTVTDADRYYVVMVE